MGLNKAAMESLTDSGMHREIATYLNLPLYRPNCSPCYLKLSDQPLTDPDVPYDTVRCDSVCVGRWGPALRVFSIYLISKVNEQLHRIIAIAQAGGLNLPGLEDVTVSIDLTSGEKRWRFQMRTVDGGHLKWDQAASRVIPKDCSISCGVTLGEPTIHARHLSMKNPRRVSEQLPVIQLRRYNTELIPLIYMIGGFPSVAYKLMATHARIYSRHRQLRGDARPDWTEYTWEGDPWEYLSGPKSRRLARRSGGPSINVDASDMSETPSSDAESSYAESNVTVDV